MTRVNRLDKAATPLPTGKFLSDGTMTQAALADVGSYPAKMVVSPDGKWIVVTNTGFREQLSVLDSQTGKLVSKIEFNKRATTGKEALYWGLAFGPDGRLYASRGREDKVSSYTLGTDGALTVDREFANPAPAKAKTPNFCAGVGFTPKTMIVANNLTSRETKLKGSVTEIDLATGAVARQIETPGFPLEVAVAWNREGPPVTKRIYVTSERDGVVASIDPVTGNGKPIVTGANPTAMILGPNDDRLYVSNSGSDTISVIDTATDKVLSTILLQPTELRGLPSCTPLGSALLDPNTLLVALADMNSLAVVDLKAKKVKGYVPVGWYPTSVVVSKDGQRIFVSNAKGSNPRNPNAKPVGKNGTYIQNIIEGNVSMMSTKAVLGNLKGLTAMAMENNRLGKNVEKVNRLAFKNPGIKHVIYVIKENRTYDNILGDLKEGNGDSDICLFPEDVTPNQHALAKRFVLLDNFYVCAEVSGDGWNWSTSGMANEYVSRNVVHNYSGRGRDYDFEGQNNGVTADFEGVNDVATPTSGYIWDLCRKHNVSMRNYGFFVGEVEELGAKKSGLEQPENSPSKKALLGVTDVYFRQFDMAYADSEAYTTYGSKAPKQLATYGPKKSPSRFSEWKSEFDAYVRKGTLPQFMMMRFPRDHTGGTAAGVHSPRAMVADNDYAVGQIVDAVTHSPFWKDTVICILEDDAQAGMDHVDAHRSLAMVVSPFVPKSLHDSRFYNTDSVLRTMELLLGLPPMNGYDATAPTINIFDAKAQNTAPYTAILPAKEIVTEVNTPTAYRSKDSERLIGRFKEESLPDIELNDILWHSVKGNKPFPR